MPQGVESSIERQGCVRPVRVAAVMPHEGRILVVRHAHSDPSKEYWVLPGGGLEPGESPMEGVRREMQEEAGVEVTVERLLYLYDQPFKGRRHLEMYFLCSMEGSAVRIGAELLEGRGGYRDELVWIAPGELSGKRFFPEMIQACLAQDAPFSFSGFRYLEG